MALEATRCKTTLIGFLARFKNERRLFNLSEFFLSLHFSEQRHVT